MTDSHSVDVETLRKKSLDASKTNSLRGSNSSVVSLKDLHPVVGSAATVTTSPRNKPQEFENGDVIVTLLPVNEKLPWITPAKFRPELVPEELMAPSLSVGSIILPYNTYTTILLHIYLHFIIIIIIIIMV